MSPSAPLAVTCYKQVLVTNDVSWSSCHIFWQMTYFSCVALGWHAVLVGNARAVNPRGGSEVDPSWGLRWGQGPIVDSCRWNRAMSPLRPPSKPSPCPEMRAHVQHAMGILRKSVSGRQVGDTMQQQWHPNRCQQPEKLTRSRKQCVMLRVLGLSLPPSYCRIMGYAVPSKVPRMAV